MAKESLKARQIKRQKMFLKYKKKRIELKKNNDYQGLQKLPKNSSPVRLHNICSLTGRSKGYMRDFGISRIEFRRLASQGFIPGIVKASW
jgi:small subunit ribosomal protein S14